MAAIIGEMTRHTTRRIRPTPPGRAQEEDTRLRLLEAAGRVFAEKGFDRATGKEICERAETNAAAVNYYFGGMDGLYVAVLEEAHGRFVTFAAASAAVAGKAGAKAKLKALIGLIVRALTDPTAASWALRVLGREIVAPSPALDSLREREFLPKSRILRGIVGELMGLSEDHPVVAHGCVSVMAPCFLLLLFDRGTLTRVFPQLGLGPQDAASLTRRLVRFSLAGLTSLAKEARSEPRP